MDWSIIATGLIASLFGYYMFRQFDLRELLSPALGFVILFLLLVLGYNQWEKYHYKPITEGDDLVLTLSSEDGAFSLPIYLGDEKAYAVIDTGATNIVIPYELAEALKLNPESLDFNVESSTANGITRSANAKLNELRISDEIVFRDVSVLVAQKGMLEGTLLGLDFLKRTSSYSVSGNVMEIRFKR